MTGKVQLHLHRDVFSDFPQICDGVVMLLKNATILKKGVLNVVPENIEKVFSA